MIFAIILIKYGNAGITGYILKSRPFVFIGRISYSIYLIHYPIIILWKFENFNVLSNNDALLIFILTIVISTITWVFIELPIRFSKTWTRKKSFILFLLSMLSIILISRLYYLNDNLFMSSKLNLSPVSHYTELESPKIDTLKGTYLNVFHSKQDLNIYNISSDFNNANTLLVGDSHCQALIFSLTEEFKKNNIKALYISDFLSIAEYKRNANYNSIFIESLLDYLRNNSQIKNIIIINRWKTTQPFYFKIERFLRDRGFNFNLYIEERETGYLNMIKDLNNLGLSIFVTSTAPEPVCNIVENRYRPEIYLPNSNLRASKEKYNSDCVAMEYMFSVMQNSKLAKFIRIEKSLEEGNYYKYLDENSNLLYYDYNHLSLHGARIVAPYLVEEFLKLRDE